MFSSSYHSLPHYTSSCFTLQVKDLLRSAKLLLRSSRRMALTVRQPQPCVVHGQLRSVAHASPSEEGLGCHAPSCASSAHALSFGDSLRYRPAEATMTSSLSEAASSPVQCKTSEAELDEEADVCVVCMERAADVTFMPCRHTLTCQPCANACLQQSSECLVCRSNVVSHHSQLLC